MILHIALTRESSSFTSVPIFDHEFLATCPKNPGSVIRTREAEPSMERVTLSHSVRHVAAQRLRRYIINVVVDSLCRRERTHVPFVLPGT